ncbi:hypothetical protein GCM10023176_62400 [Micromonospora coerulea]|uniref:Uncharacterized protein n=1 Tax=Micromonospora coerulea TaxID=47856 RepID=A0ABP8T9C6_9ACTN
MVHAPRIMLGLGRRHYGVAAQDVERELGGLVPGIVSCTRKGACPRHRGSTVDANSPCVGRLMVDYRLLAAVVAQARRCVSLPGPADASRTGPRRPRLPRQCYEQIAAIQLHCLFREGPSAGR